MLNSLSSELKQYLVVTGNYWAFTLTDGALRMLVVLYFHQLGYGPLSIAMLFLFYEIFGVITNLVGGWLGAKIGLNKTMNIGLATQIIALAMLLVPHDMLTVIWVMLAQALSGIAKDLNKMSAKSSIKTLLPDNAQGTLYKWVAILTGSKNTLKGVGFFLGAALLASLGFQAAILFLLISLSLVFGLSLLFLNKDLGKAKYKPKFKDILSKSKTINILSAARLCLFASRDVWFVVALPVYLAQQFNWSHQYIGGFLAMWIIGYGLVQTLAPFITGYNKSKLSNPKDHTQHHSQSAFKWAGLLSVIPLLIAIGLNSSLNPQWVVVIGLLLFGAIFAINSSLHSYLIVSYAQADGVSLDVGFYYMANAMGRLFGTVLSGLVFQLYGLSACLYYSAALLLVTCLISLFLPSNKKVS